MSEKELSDHEVYQGNTVLSNTVQPRYGAGQPVSPNRDADNAARANGESPECYGSPLGGANWGACG